MGRETPFTDYVRASGVGPSVRSDISEPFLARLKTGLAAELKRRRLWSVSPRIFGIIGVDSWSRDDDAALRELAQECLIFVLHRLPTLRGHARSKGNIEGLLLRLIRNFLSDRQRHFDPLGYRLYSFLSSVVEKALMLGLLHADAPAEPLDHHSRLVPAAGPGRIPAEVLERNHNRVLEAWADTHLPEFLPAIMELGPSKREPYVERLAARLPELAEQGVLDFSLGNLNAAWRQRARLYWARLSDEIAVSTGFERVGASIERIPVDEQLPGSAFEAGRAFQDLKQCVERMIEGDRDPEETRLQMLEIWLSLVASSTLDLKPPSDRALERLIEIPRRRIASLKERLRSFVHDCRGNP